MISEEEMREIMRQDAIDAEIREVLKKEAELGLAIELGIATNEMILEYYGDMPREVFEEYCVPIYYEREIEDEE